MVELWKPISALIDIDRVLVLLFAALILLFESVVVGVTLLPFAGRVAGIGIGNDIPRSFPLLATPTPHVKTVL